MLTTKPFSQLDDNDIKKMESLYETAKYEGESSFESFGYIYNKIPFDIKFFKGLGESGRVFFLVEEDRCVAYSICFDNTKGTIQNVFLQEARRYLEHEISYLKELETIGKFAYIDQIVVDREKRQKGLGKKLLEGIEQYYKEQGVLLVGAIIHENNFFPIHFFARREYAMVDFYEYAYNTHPDLKGTNIWYRICKTLQPFYATDNIKSPETLSLLLKLSSLQTLTNLSDLLSDLVPKVVVTWAGWIHDDPPLRNAQLLPPSGFVFYRSLLDACVLGREQEAQQAVSAIRKTLEYYRKRSAGIAPSVIPKMRESPHWLVLYNGDGDISKEWIEIFRDVLPFGQNAEFLKIADKDIRTNLEKKYGAGDWQIWIDFYQSLWEADLQIYSDYEWFHLVGPTNWHESYLIGCFVSLAFPTKGDSPRTIFKSFLRLLLSSLGSAINSSVVFCKTVLVTYHALRSAIAAIMSRNMSHNIGSHVLSRLTSGVINGWTGRTSVEDIIEQLCEENCKDSARSLIYWSKDTQILSRYLQQRMDFIAQISTEWPNWSEPTWFMRDMMRWFLSQKHLLNYIAHSDGLEAHFYLKSSDNKNATVSHDAHSESAQTRSDIRFHVFLIPEDCWDKACSDSQTPDKVLARKEQIKQGCTKNANQLRCPSEREDGSEPCKNCHRILLYTGEKETECRLDNDFQAAIPGGIVGQHAFFTILENFIRNAAKHGFSRQRDKIDHMDIVIEVLYDPEEKVAIQNQDHEHPRRIPAYLFRIYANVSALEDGVDVSKMNDILARPIVNEQGERIKSNLGHAEMKIAAGYLQRREITHIGGKEQEITGNLKQTMRGIGTEAISEGLKREQGSYAIIRAVKSPIGTLGYEFYIPRWRDVGIVCPEGSGTIFNELFMKEQDWRRHSVYPLRDDTDRDFELYVFVLSEQPSCLFMKVLKDALNDPDGQLQDETARAQFKQWTGTEQLATNINWIKIAIEQYPMSLYVVTKDPVCESKMHSFLKKRICWITEKEISSHLKNRDNFVLWLYAQWVRHLIIDVAEIEISDENLSVFLVFPDKDTEKPGYFPLTLPDCLVSENDNVVNRSARPDAVKIDLANARVELAGLDKIQGNSLILWYSRHVCFWDWDEDNNNWTCGEWDFWKKDRSAPIYSENLSGTLSQWVSIETTLKNPTSSRALGHFLSLVETAIIRIGIADERFQEWWSKLSKREAGFLMQQRLIATFWEKHGQYAQSSPPSHNLWAKYDPNTGEISWSQDGGEVLWAEGQRGIDLLIVHQGILDEWQSANVHQYTQQVLDWKNYIPYIVVTSGRGRPENVPFGVRFLPFAGVEACTVGANFNKMNLLRQIAVIMEGK
ncbi:MAG: GNAT family N-acetyltransferase [Candidatus Caldarchaeum sp.]